MDFAILSDPLREQASRTMLYSVLGAGCEQSMIFWGVVIVNNDASVGGTLKCQR